jgi:4-hydroxy-4-methyl-2-oxoglutarate aldolase
VTDLPPTTCLADVLQLRGTTGWLSPPLVRFAGRADPVLGTATTVRLRAAADGPGLGELQEVLSGDLSGRVVVVAGAEGVAAAVWGEILSLAAIRRGAVAALVAGRVRDVATLAAVGLPVWGLGEATAGPGGWAHVEAVGEPVRVCGVRVASGDPVLVDDGGVVALAADRADALLSDARAYADGEDAVLAALRSGEPLTSAYRHKREAVARLRAPGAP